MGAALILVLAQAPALRVELGAPPPPPCAYERLVRAQLAILGGELEGDAVVALRADGGKIAVELSVRGAVVARRLLEEAGCPTLARQLALVIHRALRSVAWTGSTGVEPSGSASAPTPDIPAPRAQLRAGTAPPRVDGGLPSPVSPQTTAEGGTPDAATAAPAPLATAGSPAVPAGPDGGPASSRAGVTPRESRTGRGALATVEAPAAGPAPPGPDSDGASSGTIDPSRGVRAERRSDASPRALWRWSGILAGGYSVTTDARRVWSGPAVTVGLSLGPLLALLSGAMHLVPEERTEVIVQDRARGTLEALSWTVRLTLGACLDLSPVKLCAGPAGTVWIRSARATGELYAARSGIDARPLFGGVLAPQLAVGAFLGALVAGCEVATSTAAVGVEGTGASLITPAWTCFASLSAGLRVP